MHHRYLEITFRNGKPFAAYLYLPRNPEDTCARTAAVNDELVIDYAADGRAIGIEILSPSTVTTDAINRALASVDQPPVTPDEVKPLAAA